MPARYRCAACGNRTRFTVTATRRSRGYYHFTIGGELTIEEEEILEESVDAIACRWCSDGGRVELDADE